MNRFDSTYEGLKQPRRAPPGARRIRFDSTYEGLKRESTRPKALLSSCFDSTYEGLKLQLVLDGEPDSFVFRQYL